MALRSTGCVKGVPPQFYPRPDGPTLLATCCRLRSAEKASLMISARWPGLLLTLLFLLAAMPVLAQQDGTYTIPSFTFENGRTVSDLKVGYTTWGKLNDKRDNAVLLLPATNGGRLWPAAYVGPGKAFDPAKYFLIGADALGTGLSSKPSDGMGAEFPRYTIRDMVRAEHELIVKGLGITKLLAVGGPSMGSFQSLEWAVNFPDAMKGIFGWVPAARVDARFHLLADAITAAVTLDANYQAGKYTAKPLEGLKRGGLVYFPWLYGDAYIATLKDPADYEKAKYSFGNAWAANWDANDLLWRYNASRGHDVSAPFKGDLAAALARVKVPALLVRSESDRLVSPDLSIETAKLLPRATLEVVPGIMGHLAYTMPAGRPEHEAFNRLTGAFLAKLAAE